jgi:hypothetical protein
MIECLDKDAKGLPERSVGICKYVIDACSVESIIEGAFKAILASDRIQFFANLIQSKTNVKRRCSLLSEHYKIMQTPIV